jgi:hypothetical protein
MMKLLDLFFTAFHSLLVLLILFGWIWKKTRRLNLVCILLTVASWLGLGIFYGLGYCPLTDWHFNILRKLGYSELPDSYLSFLFTRLTGMQIDQNLVDKVTLWGLVMALVISVFLNFRHWFVPSREKKGAH